MRTRATSPSPRLALSLAGHRSPLALAHCSLRLAAEEELGRGDAARREAERQVQQGDAEARRMALRLGLFWRVLTADAGVQYIAGGAGRRDPLLDRHLRREQAARKQAWARIYELDADNARRLTG